MRCEVRCKTVRTKFHQDLSQNRPGSTKFRSPAPKKKKQDDEEGEVRLPFLGP